MIALLIAFSPMQIKKVEKKEEVPEESIKEEFDSKANRHHGAEDLEREKEMEMRHFQLELEERDFEH